MQGRRPYQEDEYALHPHLTNGIPGLPETHFFGLFDGHAGGKCSQHVSTNLANVLLEDEAFTTNLPQAIKRAFHSCNEQFLKIAEKSKLHDGSTGIVAIIRDNKLLLANAGDCRAIVVSGGRTIQMSNDHKPTNPDEQKRINGLGGSVVYCMGVARVNRILAVSRAFGNRTLRTVIRPDAELMQRDIVDSDEFLVMASDGLWDVLKNKDVSDICYSPYLNRKPQAIAEELVQTALSRGSMDNVTCIVVALSEFRGRSMGTQDLSKWQMMESTDSGKFEGIASIPYNNNSSEEDVADLSGQTYPSFAPPRKGGKGSLLQDAHRQNSLGSIEFAEFMEQTVVTSSTTFRNPNTQGNKLMVNSVNARDRSPLVGRNGHLGLMPNPSTKDLAALSLMEGDDCTVAGDYGMDRPMTALEPLASPVPNLPRVSASRQNGIANGSNGNLTNIGNGRIGANAVNDVVGQQKASFPAHIRSLRNHGISSSLGDGLTLNNNNSSPQMQFRNSRPLSLGTSAAANWSELTAKGLEESAQQSPLAAATLPRANRPPVYGQIGGH